MFRKIQGHDVYTVESGCGAETVVGITGAFGTTDIWQQPFELLGRRYRTVAYDHFGTGLTYVPDDLVTFEHQVLLVHDLIDAFGLERCVLAADSNSTAVAIEAAHRWPGRVSALVLVSGGVVFRRNERTERFVAGLRASFEGTARAFAELCLPEDRDGHLRAWLYAIIARTGAERAARLVESFYGVDVRDRFAALRLPTLVIHGAREAIDSTLMEAAEASQPTMPNLEVHVFPEAGHVPTLSRPGEVAAAIESFLTRVLAGPVPTR